ncbi:MAG TPA: hypothetical protein VFN53_12360 [Acidobacteriaceae bacterium]|nr:hypothetical protein [Acidobacteriaceae bacterium]
MGGVVITGAFVMCAVGAYYLLEDQFSKYGRVFVRVGVIAGVIATTDWLLAWSGGLSVSCWQSAISYSSIACFAARLPQQRKRMEIKGQQSRFDPSGVKLL